MCICVSVCYAISRPHCHALTHRLANTARESPVHWSSFMRRTISSRYILSKWHSVLLVRRLAICCLQHLFAFYLTCNTRWPVTMETTLYVYNCSYADCIIGIVCWRCVIKFLSSPCCFKRSTDGGRPDCVVHWHNHYRSSDHGGVLSIGLLHSCDYA